MSEKLVERLREYAQVAHMAAAWGFAGEGFVMEKAADRIEQLVATNEELEAQVNWYRDRVVWGFYEEETPKFYQGKAGEHEICEPVNAEQVTRYFKALDIYGAKLSESEALLAKAVEALETIAFECVGDEAVYTARTTLKELKGGKDE